MNKNRKCSVCKQPSDQYSKCKPHRAEYQRQRAYELREEVRAYKVEKGCMDCGYNKHHAGLEFDHREPRESKNHTVAKLSLQGTKAACWKEISKCDVVCGTCHNIRTWNRFNKTEAIRLDEEPLC